MRVTEDKIIKNINQVLERSFATEPAFALQLGGDEGHVVSTIQERNRKNKSR